MNDFIRSSPYPAGGSGTDNKLWFFSWFMAFYIGKKIPLDTLDVVFLFLLAGNSKLLTYADLLYTQQQYWLLSVSWGGGLLGLFIQVPWLRTNLVAAGERAKGERYKKGFSTGQYWRRWDLLFQTGISGMIWCLVPSILGMLL